jgi:hypothetical protein
MAWPAPRRHADGPQCNHRERILARTRRKITQTDAGV